MNVGQPKPLAYPQRDPAALGNEMGIGDLVAILIRRWPILVGVTLLVAVLAVGATFFMTPEYRSTASLKIDPASRTISDADNRTTSPQADQARLDTEVEILKSRTLILQVVQKLGLVNDAEFADPDKAKEQTGAERLASVVDGVRDHIDVTRDSNSYLINIQVHSQSPEKAARIANTLAETYVAGTITERTGTAASQATFLRQRLDTLGAEIADAGTRIAGYRARSGLVQGGVGGNGTVTDQQIGPISQQLASAESEAGAARADLDAARQQVARGQLNEVSSVLNSSVVGDLRRQRAEVAREVAEIEARYGPRHPEYARVTGELAQIDKGLREEAQRIVGGLDSRARAATARAAGLKSSLNQLKGEQSSNTEAGVVADSLERQTKSKQDAYDRLAETLQGLTQQQRDVMPTAVLVQRATEPLTPYSPNRPLFAALGVILGLLLALGLVLLLELLKHSFQTGEELERATGLPFITSVPKLAAAKLRDGNERFSPEDFVVRKPMSSYAEAFRTIRNSIVLGVDEPARVLSVVSALPSEGKSTVALSLARSMAMSGDRVVLVDCDLRRGRLQNAVDGSLSNGLIEVLTGEAEVGAAVVQDSATDLHILPLKHNAFSPVDLFSGERMAKLVADLRSQYDFVIFDTAPVLSVADSRIIASISDGALYVARAEKTTRRAAQLATEMLAHDRTVVIGSILSMVDPRVAARGAHDPAYYYDKYSVYQQA